MSGAAERRSVQAGQPLPYHVEGKIKDCHISGHYIVRDATDTPVGYVAGRNDARVFAAAWDLLEALKACIQGKVRGPSPNAVHPSGMFCDVCGLNNDLLIHCTDCPIQLAENAIAKATAPRSGE